MDDVIDDQQQLELIAVIVDDDSIRIRGWW